MRKNHTEKYSQKCVIFLFASLNSPPPPIIRISVSKVVLSYLSFLAELCCCFLCNYAIFVRAKTRQNYRHKSASSISWQIMIRSLPFINHRHHIVLLYHIIFTRDISQLRSVLLLKPYHYKALQKYISFDKFVVY